MSTNVRNKKKLDPNRKVGNPSKRGGGKSQVRSSSSNKVQRIVTGRVLVRSSGQQVPLIRSFESQKKDVENLTGRTIGIAPEIALSSRKRRGGGGMGAVNIPPTRIVELEYITTFIGATAGAATAHTFLYPVLSNGAFDVDSSSFYSTTPGFSVMSATYSQYKTLEYQYDIEIAADPLSAVNVPVMAYVIHSDSAMGASAGGTTGLNFDQFVASRPENFTSKLITAGAGGPSLAKFKGKRSVARIYGMPFSDPNFKSLTNTIPANRTYLLVGTSTTATQNATTCIFWIKLKMKVQFFDAIETITNLEDPFAANFDTNLLRARPCAGCKKLTIVEYNPCPCGLSETCSTCGFKHPCCDICRVKLCTKRVITVPIVPPKMLQKRDSTSKIEQKTLGSPAVVTYLPNLDGVNGHAFPVDLKLSA